MTCRRPPILWTLPMLRASPLAVPLALLLRTAAVAGCSDWIMDDEYGLSVRTMDLGTGPVFSLKTQPKGTKPLSGSLPSSKYGHIISVGVNVTGPTFSHMDGDLAWAGLNEAGLSCDLHANRGSLHGPPPPPAHAAEIMRLNALDGLLYDVANRQLDAQLAVVRAARGRRRE